MREREKKGGKRDGRVDDDDDDERRFQKGVHGLLHLRELGTRTTH